MQYIDFDCLSSTSSFLLRATCLSAASKLVLDRFRRRADYHRCYNDPNQERNEPNESNKVGNSEGHRANIAGTYIRRANGNGKEHGGNKFWTQSVSIVLAAIMQASTNSIFVSEFLTFLLVDAKLDLPVEDPPVFGAENLEVHGWVVAAHFMPTSYFPSCYDALHVALSKSSSVENM